MARKFILSEAPVIEVQEPDDNGHYTVMLGSSLQFLFDAEAKKFFQYQEWASNKEITERTKELSLMEDKEEAERLFAEAKAEWKAQSKKVVYDIQLNGKDFADQVSNIVIQWVSKEYL